MDTKEMNTKQSEILNSEFYQKLIVESEDGKKIAEVTSIEATPASGYVIRLVPNYD